MRQRPGTPAHQGAPCDPRAGPTTPPQPIITGKPEAERRAFQAPAVPRRRPARRPPGEAARLPPPQGTVPPKAAGPGRGAPQQEAGKRGWTRCGLPPRRRVKGRPAGSHRPPLSAALAAAATLAPHPRRAPAGSRPAAPGTACSPRTWGPAAGA